MAVVLKYLRYILIHKWYVFVEYCKLGIPLMGIVHDMSKLYPSEFTAYMNNFTKPKLTGIAPNETDKTNFNYAWLYHQKANKHHWQYWILVYDNDVNKIVCLDIPTKFRKEMLADWIGASKAINNGANKLTEWYNENKDKIMLHQNTREWIEKQIEQHRT